MAELVREIPLLNRRDFALVDAGDYEWLSAFRWYASNSGRGLYARISAAASKDQIFMHRLIVAAERNQIVDHANRNTLDNRRQNLRIATKQQNGANSVKRPSASGFRGVYRTRDGLPWVVNIGDRGRIIYIGRFGTPEEAARAYDAAARRLYGDFAQLNFPPESP